MMNILAVCFKKARGIGQLVLIGSIGLAASVHGQETPSYSLLGEGLRIDRGTESFAISGDGYTVAIFNGRNERVGWGNAVGIVEIFEYSPIQNSWNPKGQALQGSFAQENFGRQVFLDFDGDRLSVVSGADIRNLSNIDHSLQSFDWSGGEWEPVGEKVTGHNFNLSGDGSTLIRERDVYLDDSELHYCYERADEAPEYPGGKSVLAYIEYGSDRWRFKNKSYFLEFDFTAPGTIVGSGGAETGFFNFIPCPPLESVVETLRWEDGWSVNGTIDLENQRYKILFSNAEHNHEWLKDNCDPEKIANLCIGQRLPYAPWDFYLNFDGTSLAVGADYYESQKWLKIYKYDNDEWSIDITNNGDSPIGPFLEYGLHATKPNVAGNQLTVCTVRPSCTQYKKGTNSFWEIEHEVVSNGPFDVTNTILLTDDAGELLYVIDPRDSVLAYTKGNYFNFNDTIINFEPLERNGAKYGLRGYVGGILGAVSNYDASVLALYYSPESDQDNTVIATFGIDADKDGIPDISDSTIISQSNLEEVFENEPNESQSNADSIQLDTTIVGNLNGDDLDNFKLTIDQPTLFSMSADKECEVKIIRAIDQSLIGVYQLNWGRLQFSKNIALYEAGEYIIQPTTCSSPYKISFRDLSNSGMSIYSFESEPNNESGQTSILPINNWITGQLSTPEDVDWYALNTRALTGLNLFIYGAAETAQCGWNVVVYDQNATILRNVSYGESNLVNFRVGGTQEQNTYPILTDQEFDLSLMDINQIFLAVYAPSDSFCNSSYALFSQATGLRPNPVTPAVQVGQNILLNSLAFNGEWFRVLLSPHPLDSSVLLVDSIEVSSESYYDFPFVDENIDIVIPYIEIEGEGYYLSLRLISDNPLTLEVKERKAISSEP